MAALVRPLARRQRGTGDVSDAFQTVWIGVGNGGCRTLTALAETLPDAPAMLAVHARPSSPPPPPNVRELRLFCGPGGVGTGGDPEVGRRAAIAAVDDLRAALAGRHMAVLLAGLGGGTASGAAPAIAALAREQGAFVLAFATLPFFFEGARRRQVAAAALADLLRHCDATVVFPNERICEWIPDGTPVERAFLTVDHMVGASLRTLWKLFSSPSLIHLDFADLRDLAAGSSAPLAMASAEASGVDRDRAVVAELATSPLFDHGALLRSASGVLVGIAGGPDLTLAEVQRVSAAVRDLAPSGARLHVGVTTDPMAEGRLGLTLLLAGPATPAPETAERPAQSVAAPIRSEPAPTGPGRRPVQGTLNLDAENRSKRRFSGVAPTIVDGEDLDVPAFVRRGIRLSQPPAAE